MRPLIVELNLSGNDVSEKVSLCHMDAVATAPFIIASLFLQVVKLIERLLRGQAKLVKTVNIDDRFHLGFLGSVVLPPHTNADTSVLENISMVRGAENVFSVWCPDFAAFLQNDSLF